MATKRVRRSRGRSGITPEAITAWQAGDFRGLNRALGIAPWQLSPFDVTPRREDEQGSPGYFESWPRAWALRQRLIELAGPPGRVGRHGVPLGPAQKRSAFP